MPAAMTPAKRAKLIASGWAVGNAGKTLGLTDAEEALVEIRLALSDALRTRRAAAAVAQSALAGRIDSSQSRIAKAEAADPSISIELLLRALFETGATRADIAAAVAAGAPGRRDDDERAT